MIKFKNLKEESEFLEDLNFIKSYIFLLKDIYKDSSEFLDDLDYLFDLVDDLLKYLWLF